ncbi:MAG: transcription factor [Clostridium sp.]|nr:transcription factor [Clostridium sp.]
MQQTLLDRQQLAERWGVTVRTIIKYEQQGIITRNPAFDKPKYYLEEIEKIDHYKPNPMSEMERRRLTREIEKLKNRNSTLESQLRKISTIGLESLNLINQ